MSTEDPPKELAAALSEEAKIAEQFQKGVEQFTGSIQMMIIVAGQILKAYGEILVSGLKNFEYPEKYDSQKVEVNEIFRQTANDMAKDVLDRMRKGKFSHLSERYERGLDAHKTRDYQSSLFCLFSVIDGLLRSYFYQHNDYFEIANKYPTFDQLFDHFKTHYIEKEIFVHPEELDEILKKLFKHRHEIVHGGKKAFFDENLSVIALMVIALVYNTVERESLRTITTS